MDKYIEISKSKLISEDYRKSQIEQAKALLMFRNPGYEVKVEEFENKFVVTAAPKKEDNIKNELKENTKGYNKLKVNKKEKDEGDER